MWRLLAVLLASYQLSVLVECGSQVDESGQKCEEQNIRCPRRGQDKSYEKYCCYESSGTVDCCNPYFALELGVGIGVPLVILIIVCMVITYCCCAYRQRRRERIVYYGNLEDEEELVNTFKTNKNDELPPYSEADPYSEEPPEYTPVTDDNDDQSTTIYDNNNNVNN